MSPGTVHDSALSAAGVQWDRWRTSMHLLVTHPAELARTRAIVDAELAELIAAALGAARVTDGDVDPTVGLAIIDLGYDRRPPGFPPSPSKSTGAPLNSTARTYECRQAPCWIWRSVSVAADSCLAANTVSTAAIVRGYRAITWITELGVPARLIDRDGGEHTIGGWPA